MSYVKKQLSKNVKKDTKTKDILKNFKEDAPEAGKTGKVVKKIMG